MPQNFEKQYINSKSLQVIKLQPMAAVNSHYPSTAFTFTNVKQLSVKSDKNQLAGKIKAPHRHSRIQLTPMDHNRKASPSPPFQLVLRLSDRKVVYQRSDRRQQIIETLLLPFCVGSRPPKQMTAPFVHSKNQSHNRDRTGCHILTLTKQRTTYLHLRYMGETLLCNYLFYMGIRNLI